MKKINKGLKAGALRSRIHGFIRSLNPQFSGLRSWNYCGELNASVIDGKLLIHTSFYQYPGKDRETIKGNLDNKWLYQQEMSILKKIHKKFGGVLAPVKKIVHGYGDSISSIQYKKVLTLRVR